MPSIRLALSLVISTRLAVACGGGAIDLPEETPVAAPVRSDVDALSGHLEAGASAVLGPIEATPGDVLAVRFQATGAAVLQFRGGDVPEDGRFDGSLKAGAAGSIVTTEVATYLRVVATEAVDFHVKVLESRPAPGFTNTARVHRRFEGELDLGTTFDLIPLDVTGLSRVRVAVGGQGNTDLTLRFDAAPEADASDCVGIEDGADACELDVPAGATQLFVRLVAIENAHWTLDYDAR